MAINPYASSQSELEDQRFLSGPSFDGMSPKDIKKLYMHSRTINVVAWLWGIIGLVASTATIFVAFNGDLFEGEGAILFAFLLGGSLTLHIAVAVAMRMRPAWARPVAMVWAGLSFITFRPLAIIIAVLVLYALWNGKPLFGENRLTHQELKDAWRACKRGTRFAT